MNGIEYLIGGPDTEAKPDAPFSEEACAYLNRVSSLLMKGTRAYPDVLTFAFWCRKANTAGLKLAYSDLERRLGRGLAFHIAPSNVPVNFAFSFVFSLLAGNANIVRVPSKLFPQIELIINAMREALADFPILAKRTAFVRYSSDNDEATAAFCKMADIRIIWGGDDTIDTIRRMHAKPRCIDIAFADRYSIAIINAKAVIEASDDDIRLLAEHFYNDTYLMDQNACSSAQLVLWKNDAPEARRRFWDAVHTCAKQKYILQSAVAVDKYTKLFENILDHDLISGINYEDNYLYLLELCRLPSDINSLRGVAGYFYEYPITEFDELCGIVNEKLQTVACFGIDMEAFRTFVVDRRLSGIDRIVPIGAAMDIGIIWDGYDLIGMLSRIIAIG